MTLRLAIEALTSSAHRPLLAKGNIAQTPLRKNLVDTGITTTYNFGSWRNTDNHDSHKTFLTTMNEAFTALSDPTRREILRLLREQDMTAGEICEQFDLARSTLSGHFTVLKHAGLIVAEKSGTTITYSLNLSAVESLLGSVMDLLGTTPKTKKKSKRK